MKKQTAVEWLKKELEEYGSSSHLSLDWETFDKLVEQAKAMERSQIKDAQMDMFHKLNDIQYGVAYLEKRDFAETFCKKYYKETYKGGEQ
jgi:hypothetical protein